jgi:hypothetical protein
MHTFIINIILLTLCHFNIFQPLKDHLQGVRQIYFDSKVNKMSYQIPVYKIQLIEHYNSGDGERRPSNRKKFWFNATFDHSFIHSFIHPFIHSVFLYVHLNSLYYWLISPLCRDFSQGTSVNVFEMSNEHVIMLKVMFFV